MTDKTSTFVQCFTEFPMPPRVDHVDGVLWQRIQNRNQHVRLKRQYRLAHMLRVGYRPRCELRQVCETIQTSHGRTVIIRHEPVQVGVEPVNYSS
jgi:hypothetical protein